MTTYRSKNDRNFKGIWIPKLVYLDKSLSWTEKILLVEIDSLDGAEGCFASNEYLAEFLGVNKTTASTAISKLKKRGYIYQVGWKGRFRVLRSNLQTIIKMKNDSNDYEEPTLSENQKHNKQDNKQESNYKEFISVYHNWCKHRLGVGAKIDASDGKAMKEIISYLKSQADDGQELDAWKFILGNWDRLDKFLQNQIKIRQINSNLINILNQFRNAKTSKLSSLEQKIRSRNGS